MTSASPEISIVVPVYRSQIILPHLVERIGRVMENQIASGNLELILVNDASPDDSWTVVRRLVEQYSFVKGIELARNFGQHNATMAGLNAASGDVVVIMDDDLQHPPETIMSLVKAVRDGHDVCYTEYVNRRHAAWKQWGSRFNDYVATFLLKKPRGLYLSSYKAMHQRVVREVIKYDGPYAYIDGLILDVTRNIAVAPIEHQSRFEGEGNYNLRKSISLWLKMATSFSIVPLRLASFAGMLLAAISVVVMIAIVVDKFVNPATPAGWTSLLAVILFMGSLQLMCLGFVGEYLGRAYLRINRKPQFTVRERIGFNDQGAGGG